MENRDTYLNRLNPLLKQEDYELFSKWSMSSYGLYLLATEIRKFRPNHIIEFGSGASSIVMARSIQIYHPKGRIISVENDPYYCDNLNDFALKNGLNEIVRFIYAPLYPCPYLPDNKWYDCEVLHEHINSQYRFDLVVIDGPPAWNDKIRLSRYGAIPFVMNYLSDDYSIFLDDANREGEKRIMEMWKEKYEITFTILKHRLAVYRKDRN